MIIVYERDGETVWSDVRLVRITTSVDNCLEIETDAGTTMRFDRAETDRIIDQIEPTLPRC